MISQRLWHGFGTSSDVGGARCLRARGVIYRVVPLRHRGPARTQGPVDVMTVSENDQYRFWFYQLASQYYVVGRFAARAGLNPSCGNLLHHAVEMFLKGALVDDVGLGEMKN